MTTQAIDPHWAAQRSEWLILIQSLLDDARRWAEDEGWAINEAQKNINEDLLGAYTVPTLQIRTPGGKLFVEPVARRIIGGADGRIDIEAWPSLHRVKLLRMQNQWSVVTDSGVRLRDPWNQQTFRQLVQDLNSAP